MKQVEYYHWMLPPDVWSKKPRQTSFKLTAEEARQKGAIKRLDETREVREVAESEEERFGMLFKNNTSDCLRGPENL